MLLEIEMQAMKVHRLAKDDRPLNLNRLRDEAAILQSLLAEADRQQRQARR
jgi:hypothetical protein